MNEQMIYEKLVAIMQETKALGKDSRNQQQGFKFRGIDAVMNHLHPVFARHGVVVIPEVVEDRTEERQTRSGGNLIYRVLKTRYHFTATDGSRVSSTVIGEGMDSGDKAANKAMAVGLKYALTQVLLLPYDEIDPDSETHEPSTPADTPSTKRKPTEAWITACQADPHLAAKFKAARLTMDEGRRLWEQTEGDDTVRAEQFAILIDETLGKE